VKLYSEVTNCWKCGTTDLYFTDLRGNAGDSAIYREFEGSCNLAVCVN
jgi:hypothetical protein